MVNKLWYKKQIDTLLFCKQKFEPKKKKKQKSNQDIHYAQPH